MINVEEGGLFEAADRIANEIDSVYRNVQTCREHLMDFMEANQWFGVSYEFKNGIPFVAKNDYEKFRGPLVLWLSAYRKSGHEKIKLLLQYFDGIYPITCQLYKAFVKKKGLENADAAWKLLDYMFSEISKEIIEYSEGDIEYLLSTMHAEATIAVVNLFVEFLQTMKYNNRPLTTWKYKIETHERVEEVKGAYSMKNFSVMAYCVFNDNMWRKNDLIKKAVSSQVYANLWLFVALHFICALRISDIKRLPAPILPYNNDIMQNKILSNNLRKEEIIALVEELLIRIDLKPIKPSKTATYSNVPNLKLFVPESLKQPLGTIMAIALAHHSETKISYNLFETESNLSWKLSQLKYFFGTEFLKALGNRRFSSLRANKSYLQGIEATANINDDAGKIKGYMIAALARSHKSSIGSLAKTTDIYLRDARFSGYSPEFIIREMFERGIFSFIPAILLEMYAGNKYKMLPVTMQTDLIGKIGITPYQIEKLASFVDKAIERSKKTVGMILSDMDNVEENVFLILQNIASGNAPGRCDECLCLKIAAGFSCPYSDRDSCIGCGFEIYTKAAIHTLMKEYIRFHVLKKSTTNETDAKRYTAILEKTIMPVVTEMVSAAKILYQEEDLPSLLDEIERGITYVSSSI